MNISEIAKKIDHVVVLMMENRSFDHLFGFYKGVVGTEWGLKAPNSKDQYFNYSDPQDPTSSKHLVTQIDLAQQISLNPYHSFAPMIHDIFGADVKGVKNNEPISTAGYKPPYPSAMSGFYQANQSPKRNGDDALTAFADGSLKVLHTLADNFVLCANWFCDTPSETVPNRHFVHAATNMGWNDSNPSWPVHQGHKPNHEHTDIFLAKTLYENLDAIASFRKTMEVNWAMYGFRGFGPNGQSACSYDSDMYQYTNTNDKQRFDAAHRNIGDFQNDVKNGKLPFYTFINPSLNYPGKGKANGNSMHPASHVQYGENFVAHIYNILRGNSNIWNRTLLIVTFDENGGLFDHVRPKTSNNPDGINYPPGFEDPLFDYSCLGPRIPSLLISPWLQNSHGCFQSENSLQSQIDTIQYQNTSIPRFVQDLLQTKINPNISAPSLTKRDKHATSFAESPYWRDELALQPAPSIPLYQESNYPWYYPLKADPEKSATHTIELTNETPTPDAIDLVLQYVSHLPGHFDSGKPVTRQFETCLTLWEYLQERNRAARNSSI